MINAAYQNAFPWRKVVWGTGATLLVLPLLFMQFTDEVNWDFTDFLIFAAMLIGVGLSIEFIAKNANNSTYRYAAGAALAACFLLLMMTGAVGIIGSSANDANLMYFGVLAIGFLWSLLSRFQAKGMAYAMLATGLAQVIVGAAALLGKLGPEGTNWPFDLIGISGFFTALWLLASWLFRKSANETT